jgi:hypothetical protein
MVFKEFHVKIRVSAAIAFIVLHVLCNSLANSILQPKKAIIIWI